MVAIDGSHMAINFSLCLFLLLLFVPIPTGFVLTAWPEEQKEQQCQFALQDSDGTMHYFYASCAESCDFETTDALITVKLESIALAQVAKDDKGQPQVKLTLKDHVEEAIQNLRSADSSLRETAARILGESKDPRAVAPLILALKDNLWDVRKIAAKSLGELGDSRAVEPLIQALEAEDPYVRATAAESLGKLADHRAIKPLKKYLLKKMAGRQLVGPNIQQWVVNEEWQVMPMREKLADALAKILGHKAVPILSPFLEEHDPQIRSAVAKALGLLGDKNAILPLRNALPDWLAQETFIEGLVKLGWHPQSNEERVYLWVAKKDAASLMEHWNVSKNILISDLKSTHRKRIENSTYTFISLGMRSITDEMVQILNIHGNKEMAETYLNSGYEYLENAARRWAEEKGYSIAPGSGAHHVSWGSW